MFSWSSTCSAAAATTFAFGGGCSRGALVCRGVPLLENLPGDLPGAFQMSTGIWAMPSGGGSPVAVSSTQLLELPQPFSPGAATAQCVWGGFLLSSTTARGAASTADQLRARSRSLPPHINLFPPQAPKRGWGVTSEPLQNQSLMSTLAKFTSSTRELHPAGAWTHRRRSSSPASTGQLGFWHLGERYHELQKWKRNWRWVTTSCVQGEQQGEYFWKVLCCIYWAHQTKAMVLCRT